MFNKTSLTLRLHREMCFLTSTETRYLTDIKTSVLHHCLLMSSPNAPGASCSTITLIIKVRVPTQLISQTKDKATSSPKRDNKKCGSFSQ